MHLLTHHATCTPADMLNIHTEEHTHAQWTDTNTQSPSYACAHSSHSLPALLAACHCRLGVPRCGQVQMVLSRLSPNRISQNTPVTAGTCAPSQSGATTETNYHQQSSRCRVHGARASSSPYKVAETGDKSTVSLAYASLETERERGREIYFVAMETHSNHPATK